MFRAIKIIVREVTNFIVTYRALDKVTLVTLTSLARGLGVQIMVSGCDTMIHSSPVRGLQTLFFIEF
jgi:hypothetical protein